MRRRPSFREEASSSPAAGEARAPNWERWWAALRPALRPLGALWGGLMRLRRLAYRRGLLPAYRPRALVVSVGNLSLGGEGKTPLVAWLAEHLRQQGRRVAVLTRGYGGRLRGPAVVSRGEGPLLPPAACGDEAVLLARLTEAPVLVARDRVAGVLAAERLFGAEVVVLDDGFQHLRLARDLDLVLFSGDTDLDGERVFPAGRLREPLSALRDAHAFVVTKANLVVENLSLWRRLRSFARPVFRVPYLLGEPRLLAGGAARCPEALVAFCGLGRPESFFRALRDRGFRLVAAVSFPDHHAYGPGDLARLAALARRHGVPLATTEKDAVKLEPLAPELPPCYVFPLIPRPGEGFVSFLARRLAL